MGCWPYFFTVIFYVPGDDVQTAGWLVNLYCKGLRSLPFFKTKDVRNA